MHFPSHSKTFAQTVESNKDKQIVVIGHMRPDGDCIGSQIALTRSLIQQGFDAVAVNNDPVTDVLKVFVNDTPIMLSKDFKPKPQAIAITVDCGDKDRIGKILNDLFPEITLNIDHHFSNTSFAKDNIVRPQAASATEILSGLLLDNDYPIDEVTATALFLGLVTDTGQFQYASTSAETFLLASKLMQLGAKPSYIGYCLYECEPKERMELLKLFLNTLKFELGGKVATSFVNDEMYLKTGALRQHTEGFVDFTRQTTGVLIGVFLEEFQGTIKGSLRCKNDSYRVDKLAAIYGGGGHICAAGFNVSGSTLEDFYPKFLKTVEEHLQSVEKS